MVRTRGMIKRDEIIDETIIRFNLLGIHHAMNSSLTELTHFAFTLLLMRLSVLTCEWTKNTTISSPETADYVPILLVYYSRSGMFIGPLNNLSVSRDLIYLSRLEV